MADKSGIEWTDATWNPTTGCDRVSPGCARCYALDLAARLKKMGAPAYQADGDPRTSGPGFALTLQPDRLGLPLRWTRPRRIFVNSMSDLFHALVPDLYAAAVFAVMAAAPRHTFQVLTKRPERMRRWSQWAADLDRYSLTERQQFLEASAFRYDLDLSCDPDWPLENVWLGTSIENNRWVGRADALRETPAAVRFLSCEPLIGPLPDLDLEGIGWVIVGGESGAGHRPIDPAWVRDLRDRSTAAGVPFFFKQWGGRTPKSGGRELDGRTWDEMPVGALTR